MKKVIFILAVLIIIIMLILQINRIQKMQKNDNFENEILYDFKYFSPINSEVYYGDTMKFHNSIYYEVINDYKEYLLYKNNYQDILDMSEKDFETNFMILTVTENESTKNLAFGSINSDNNTLYIGLSKENSIKEPDLDRGISIKIDRALLKENVDIYITIDDIDFMNNYENIKNLSQNYTIENAIADRCFVIITNPASNIDVFDEFIDNINNNKDAEIRIVSQLSTIENSLLIYDIKYSNLNNKYYVCKDSSRSTMSSESYNYFEFDSFEKEDLTDSIFREPQKISSYQFYNNEFPETNIKIQFYNTEY